MIYEKVKFVEGENFITIEEGDQLSEQEMKELIDQAAQDDSFRKVDHLTILLDDTFSTEREVQLQAHGFRRHDEVIFVSRDLRQLPEWTEVYEMKSLREIPKETFKDVWEKSMKGSLNASSYLNMDEQMQSVEKELGPSYIDTCNVAYEDGVPIGVVLPHIEPGTEDEGRIFYFGLVPEQRGKRKAEPLYKQGLMMLKDQFCASYSVGGTSVNNQPMQKVFAACGCVVTSRVKVYKRSRS
ncbi:GNAT family N-acetyltransferase [Halobacillus salinus]|uniref:GNAT family N-acetyltransferase n=1 Tax=Halobacillus salinus TaxID=192814 RepID=A0A4Z0H148_9BACI|nr:GNAT family N-acetyltransferase [Halobacillus salinus]TGB02777.1 GNAT family N-acetyltransferase [Halobacillus salinus]